jgi:hypothetical protein
MSLQNEWSAPAASATTAGAMAVATRIRLASGRMPVLAVDFAAIGYQG